MIRKKLPSAITPYARTSCAVKGAAKLTTMRVRATANSAPCQHFMVRPDHLRAAAASAAVSRGVPSDVLAKRCARQVLPRGRQKTPCKHLKNNEKSSPGFVLRVVQRSESRSASGYGIGVGEWG